MEIDKSQNTVFHNLKVVEPGRYMSFYSIEYVYNGATGDWDRKTSLLAVENLDTQGEDL